jgi:lipopolysaccharide export system protein LptA
MAKGGERMRKTERFTLFLIVGSCLFLLIGTGQAQEPKKARKTIPNPAEGVGFGFNLSRAPIDIVSDTVEGNQKENTVSFKGNVIAKQEDITIQTDLMTVFYDPATKKVKEIIATGNVRVVQLDRRATSKRATFYQNENRVVLDGDVVIREGDNVLRGERVTYYIDEERSVVEGAKGSRVTTTISPVKKEDSGTGQGEMQLWNQELRVK